MPSYLIRARVAAAESGRNKSGEGSSERQFPQKEARETRECGMMMEFIKGFILGNSNSQIEATARSEIAQKVLHFIQMANLN